MTRIRVIQGIALAPVVVAAVINSGYQYLLALDVAQGAAPGDWRDRMVARLGIDYLDPSIPGMAAAGLIHVIPVLATAIVAGGLCERAFASGRDLPMDKGFLLIAVVFTLLLPPAASLVHVALGMAFAMVFGKGVFGGEGKSFVNPALLAMAVVQISFPAALTGHPLWTGVAGYGGTSAFALYQQSGMDGLKWAGMQWWHAFFGATQGMIGTTSVAAIAVGAALLIWQGIASWRLVAAHAAGLTLAAGLAGLFAGGAPGLPWHWHLVLGSFAFGIVFVATDPSSSASTHTGRWVQGIVAGVLVVVIRVVNPSHPDGVIPALLLGSMLAPLIDHVVVWFNIRARARSHG